LGVLGYSGRPLSLKYRALGDVAVFFLCGPLLTLAYSVASFGVYNSEVLWMGAGFGFAAVAILHANNLQDIPDDTLRGAQTLASKLGFELARFGVAFFYVCSLASFLIFCEASERWLPILFSLCALPLMIKLSRKSIQAPGPRSPLLHLTRIEAANIHLALGVLVSLGLLANP
jgi:1,4-dihydroxy-2-naphthoate octaprenyltransferase